MNNNYLLLIKQHQEVIKDVLNINFKINKNIFIVDKFFFLNFEDMVTFLKKEDEYIMIIQNDKRLKVLAKWWLSEHTGGIHPTYEWVAQKDISMFNQKTTHIPSHGNYYICNEQISIVNNNKEKIIKLNKGNTVDILYSMDGFPVGCIPYSETEAIYVDHLSSITKPLQFINHCNLSKKKHITSYNHLSYTQRTNLDDRAFAISSIHTNTIINGLISGVITSVFCDVKEQNRIAKLVLQNHAKINPNIRINDMDSQTLLLFNLQIFTPEEIESMVGIVESRIEILRKIVHTIFEKSKEDNCIINKFTQEKIDYKTASARGNAIEIKNSIEEIYNFSVFMQKVSISQVETILNDSLDNGVNGAEVSFSVRKFQIFISFKGNGSYRLKSFDDDSYYEKIRQDKMCNVLLNRYIGKKLTSTKCLFKSKTDFVKGVKYLIAIQVCLLVGVQVKIKVNSKLQINTDLFIDFLIIKELCYIPWIPIWTKIRPHNEGNQGVIYIIEDESLHIGSGNYIMVSKDFQEGEIDICLADKVCRDFKKQKFKGQISEEIVYILGTIVKMIARKYNSYIEMRQNIKNIDDIVTIIDENNFNTLSFLEDKS